MLRPVPNPIKGKKKRVIQAPKDENVREIANEVAITCPSSKHIQNFDNAVRIYCGFVLRYQDRTVVPEYLYLRLKRFIEHERKHGRSVRKEILRAYAKQLFAEIEIHILDMARRGRRIKTELPKGRYAILAHVGERSGRQCFLVCEDDADRFPFILCLQTAKQFNRKHRRRIRERNEYKNNHPICRRSEMIH